MEKIMKFRYENRDEYNIKEVYRHYDLEMSPYMLQASNKEIRESWNGIGREGAWYNDYIPDTVWGLDISLISADHDLSYGLERTLQKKKLTDDRFYRNGCKIIDKESIWILRWIRKRRLLKYYLAVKFFGFKAFNKSIELPYADLLEAEEKQQTLNCYRTIGGFI